MSDLKWAKPRIFSAEHVNDLNSNNSTPDKDKLVAMERKNQIKITPSFQTPRSLLDNTTCFNLHIIVNSPQFWHVYSSIHILYSMDDWIRKYECWERERERNLLFKDLKENAPFTFFHWAVLLCTSSILNENTKHRSLLEILLCIVWPLL